VAQVRRGDACWRERNGSNRSSTKAPRGVHSGRLRSVTNGYAINERISLPSGYIFKISRQSFSVLKIFRIVRPRFLPCVLRVETFYYCRVKWKQNIISIRVACLRIIFKGVFIRFVNCTADFFFYGETEHE